VGQYLAVRRFAFHRDADHQEDINQPRCWSEPSRYISAT
jgi:hypothetical protein